MRILIIAFLNILICTQICFAQRAVSTVKNGYDIYTDTARKILSATAKDIKVDLRILSDDILEKYKNDPDFNYEGSPMQAEDWITKIKNWINQQLALLRSSKIYSAFWDYFYYGLMFIALILIVRGIILADRRGVLFGRIDSNEIKFTEEAEDIERLDFDELISASIFNKQYKLAIRYLFLKSLKLLSDKNIIDLRNNKTNYQYLSEIKNNQIAASFRNTADGFEWIWYGDFPVDDDIMKSLQKDFNQLFVLIKAR